MRMRKHARAAFGTKSSIFVSFSNFDGLDCFSCKQNNRNQEVAKIHLCENCIFIRIYCKNNY